MSESREVLRVIRTRAYWRPERPTSVGTTVLIPNLVNHVDEVVLIAGRQPRVVALLPPSIEYGDGGTNVDIYCVVVRITKSSEWCGAFRNYVRRMKYTHEHEVARGVLGG